MKKADIVAIAAILAAALAVFLIPAMFAPPTNGEAVVSRGGEILAALPLGRDGVTEFAADSHPFAVEVSGGRVRVLHADCPDQVCVRSGWIRYGGQSLVCLPYRVIVELPRGKSGADAVAR